MKFILFYIAFLSCSITYSQTRLLERYNFSTGQYYILGKFSESDKNTLKDSLGEFYTDSISILNEFKKEWIFKKPSPAYACGYHYTIQICKGGQALETFKINLDCNVLYSDKGYFYFDIQKLRMFYGKLKKAHRQTKQFATLDEARFYRSSILSNNSLIMAPDPDWTRFEGEFDFAYICKQGTKTCYKKRDSLIKIIREKILNTYPGEAFELREKGGSWTDILLTISCNKSLSDKFNLYSRDTEGPFGKWKPYNLSLTTYWTSR